MIKRFVKNTLRFFLVILLFIVLLFVASKMVEKKVVSLMVEQINQSVEVPVFIDNIQFSLLKKFPYATLQLRNITIKSAPGFNKSEFVKMQPDTLLFVSDLYLVFNMLSLFHREMELTKAYVEGGFLNILVDHSGKSNYSVFEQLKSPETDTTGSFKTRLKAIEVNQMNICFQNNFKGVSTQITIPSYKLKGEFYKDSYQVITAGSVLVNEVKQGKLWFKPDVPAQLNLEFNIQNKIISIQKSNLNSAGLQLQTSGTLNFRNDLQLDLHFSGTQIDLKKLSRWVSDPSARKIEVSGKLSFEGIVKGVLNEKTSPKMAINFQIAQGSFKNEFLRTPANNIEIKGSYTNGNQRNITTSILNFEKFNADFGTSHIFCQLKIQNFRQPIFSFDTELNANSEDVKDFIPKQTGLFEKGNLNGKLHAQGEIHRFPLSLDQIRSWHFDGLFKMNQLSFSTSDQSFKFNQASATLKITSQELRIDSINGNFQNTSGWGTLSIKNYWGLFSSDNEEVFLNTTWHLSQVTYSDIAFLFTGSDTSETSYQLNVDAKIFADSYEQDALKAQHIFGSIHYQNEKVMVDSLTFDAFDGKARSRIVYDFSNPRYYGLSVKGRINSMDMNLVLKSFKNFGQTFITDKNLYGKVTSDFDMSMKFIKGAPDYTSIDFLGYVRIDEGKLQNFEPVKELALFSEIPEFENVEFSSLENNLLISQGEIQIPKMDIHSNAFDISLYGSQQFSGNYEYHLQIYLSDFLTGKTKRIQNQQTEYGWVVEDDQDRTKLFLIMLNKNNDFSITIDKQAIKSQLKEGTQNEKKEFKKALHDEFGWFKKDSTLNKPVKKESKKQEFTIEWDEE